MISIPDFLWFLDDALDDMVATVTLLGDENANRSPDLPGANSPYAILTHCLGMMSFWSGQVIAGRDVHRDRSSEFVATGRVEDLVARAREGRAQLGRDLEQFDAAAPPLEVDPEDVDLPLGRTQGAVLFHIYEELAQHRGQLEITRDILLAG